jgi:methionine synthase I (cobalamin-dependent)
MVEMLRVVREAAPQGVFSVMPNAGLPVQGEQGELRYPVGAAEFAAYVPTFLELGAWLVGGCCGTTPAYVAAMRKALDRH